MLLEDYLKEDKYKWLVKKIEEFEELYEETIDRKLQVVDMTPPWNEAETPDGPVVLLFNLGKLFNQTCYKDGKKHCKKTLEIFGND